MPSARQRELAGGLEAGPRRAEVGVRVLRGRGVLRSAGGQQRDLVHYVLHLVREGLRLLQKRRLRQGVAPVLLGVGVAAEVVRRTEALADAGAALERRLHHADDAARRLAPRVARARLVRLQRRRGRERHLAVLAHVAQVEVQLARARRRLAGGRRQAQRGRAWVGRDVPDLLQGAGRQLQHAGAVPCLHYQALWLWLKGSGVDTRSCNNRK